MKGSYSPDGNGVIQMQHDQGESLVKGSTERDRGKEAALIASRTSEATCCPRKLSRVGMILKAGYA